MKIKTQKYNIQMGNPCSTPCLWKAWHLTGPGHPLAQWILIPYVWNRHYNVFQWICGCWNLDKQYSVRWLDLSLCMAWHLRGQDIHRHSEDQIHMHDTQIVGHHRGTNGMLRSPQKQYPVGWSAPDLGMAWHLQGQDIHRHSEDHIHIQETETKMNIKILCLL